MTHFGDFDLLDYSHSQEIDLEVNQVTVPVGVIISVDLRSLVREKHVEEGSILCQVPIKKTKIVVKYKETTVLPNFL